MEKEITDILLLDEEYKPILIEEECKKLKPILNEFVNYYAENKYKPVEEWLSEKLQEELPEEKNEKILKMTKEIIEVLNVNETNKISLEKAIINGRSKESWFTSSVKKSMSAMSTQESVKYLTKLDNALQTANESLYQTITTQAGNISQNTNLDGFIAEQYHAQTFNMNAKATGSQYRAKVLEPNGKGYAKNSVDIVIVDGNGKVVRRYQAKYYKNSEATEQAFKNGDYRGQQKLIPEDQNINGKATTILEAPDGTTSNPLTKSQAKKMRDEAQSGKWNELNWNEYATKDLVIGIGKQAGYAALQGAAIGVGFDIAQKVWNGEKVKSEDLVKTAITSGTDFGVKAAVSGALKVGVEKKIITVIPKGTPAGTIANIAFVAVENAKILKKMITGELSIKESIEKMEQITVATVSGLVAMGKGSAVGAIVGAVFGPVGSAVGGFIGGTVGYMAGSKVGETIVRGAQKLRNGAIKVAKTIASGIKNTVSSVASSVKSFCSGVASFFGL